MNNKTINTMNNKTIKNIITILILSSLFTSVTAKAIIFITPKPPTIKARSHILIDYNSNKILSQSNINERTPPASLAKIMTAYVVFQFIKDGRINLEDEIKISKNAWQTGGSKSFIEVGKIIKLKTLLKGMIIQSGNDAAVAIAEHIAGDEETFAGYMNEYAKELGMHDSHFNNASGLPKGEQYTSAYDMVILSKATIKKFPELYSWYKEKEFTYNNIKQLNRNKLLWNDKSVDGLKTGYTEKAGYCLVASAKQDDMRLISVVLGANSKSSRIVETKKNLNYGFRFFETKKMTLDKEIPIFKSKKNTIKVGITNNNYITLPRGQFKLTKKAMIFNKKLSAPINKNEKVGELVFTFEDKEIAKLDIVSLEDAQESNFFMRTIDSIKLLF